MCGGRVGDGGIVLGDFVEWDVLGVCVLPFFRFLAFRPV